MNTIVKTLATKVLLLVSLLVVIGTNRAFGQSEFSDLVDIERKADALRIAGRGREALPLADHLVARAGEVFSDHPGNLAACYEQAGLVYWNQGLYAKAELLLKRTILIREEAFGTEDPLVALAANNLANVY